MLGQLPSELHIGGRDIPIRNTDYRQALIVVSAIQDPNLTDREKYYIMVDALVGVNNISQDEYTEAIQQCAWYIDGGNNYSNNAPKPKLVDWEHDEQIIFSAVNNVAGKELRSESYCHWWTFIGYFNEIRDGVFSQVVTIRQKKAKGKKLEKSEREFYSDNKDMIDIKRKYSDEEQKEIDELNERFK